MQLVSAVWGLPNFAMCVCCYVFCLLSKCAIRQRAFLLTCQRTATVPHSLLHPQDLTTGKMKLLNYWRNKYKAQCPYIDTVSIQLFPRIIFINTNQLGKIIMTDSHSLKPISYISEEQFFMTLSLMFSLNFNNIQTTKNENLFFRKISHTVTSLNWSAEKYKGWFAGIYLDDRAKG